MPRPVQNFPEDPHQVDGVGRDLLLGALFRTKLPHRRIGPGGGFDLLLLQQHLGRVLEALVLQQPLHQLAPRILLLPVGPFRRHARKKHAALDVDQQRSHINEVRRRIHLGLLQALHVGQKLGRDPADGDVVDIDVLLADQVQQQVQRPVVHLAHS